nr:FAD:protein FMN transferase [Pelomonas aquatica]
MLGTLVDIEVQAPADVAEPALALAFRRVAEVHAAMSFHDAASDLRRVARAAAGTVLRVAPDTHAVLALALRLEAGSDGAFNPCCAAALVERGLLPRPDDALPGTATSLAEGIELLDDAQLRLRRPVWIDLGGIAKGHAVDAAVQALRDAGVAAGVVNAGGDLRTFGPQPLTVQLRDPRRPGLARPVAEIRDMACATSAWLLGACAAERSARAGASCEARPGAGEAWVGTHNEPATPHGPANRPGPSGWAWLGRMRCCSSLRARARGLLAPSLRPSQAQRGCHALPRRLLAQPDRRAAHLVGPARGVEDNPPMSVTVFAPCCAVADALTKVVWLRGAEAAPLLRAERAQALLWREQDEPLTL